MRKSDRYDRQERIKGWQQQALARAHILVAGAGALGNELIKNLVLAGIGHVMIMDFDHIELSNLSRSVLFRTGNIGQPKAMVAAQAAVELNPDVDIRHINGDLFYDVGLGFYRHADLVVSGLDNLAARAQVGLSCSLAGVSFLDGGMWALGGEIRWFVPGHGPCFECTLTDEDRKHAHERQSCSGFINRTLDTGVQPMPSTISTTAVIGGLLAQEAIRHLCGWEVNHGEAIVYNGLTMTMHRATLPRDPKCSGHLPYQEVIELDSCVAETTARELLESAQKDLGKPAILELGRDFLLGFRCVGCGRQEPVDELMGKVDEAKRVCPHCGNARDTEIISRLDGSESYADRPLSQLGVPPGEILAVRGGDGDKLRLYELTGDVERFWG